MQWLKLNYVSKRETRKKSVTIDRSICSRQLQRGTRHMYVKMLLIYVEMAAIMYLSECVHKGSTCVVIEFKLNGPWQMW